MLWCSIGSDEDDRSEEASVDDPSETAVSRDAAKELSHGVYTLLTVLQLLLFCYAAVLAVMRMMVVAEVRKQVLMIHQRLLYHVTPPRS